MFTVCSGWLFPTCSLVTPFWHSPMPRMSPAGVNQVQRPESAMCSQTQVRGEINEYKRAAASEE